MEIPTSSLLRVVRGLDESDGYGRSDTREALRSFFEVDTAHIVVAVLTSLVDQGAIGADVVTTAIERYEIDPEAPRPGPCEASQHADRGFTSMPGECAPYAPVLVWRLRKLGQLCGYRPRNL